MATEVDATEFMKATVVDRAILLLKRAFAEPEQPISRHNVAFAIASAAGVSGSGGMIGATVVGGGSRDRRVLRLSLRHGRSSNPLDSCAAIWSSPTANGGT